MIQSICIYETVLGSVGSKTGSLPLYSLWSSGRRQILIMCSHNKHLFWGYKRVLT